MSLFHHFDDTSLILLASPVPQRELFNAIHVFEHIFVLLLVLLTRWLKGRHFDDSSIHKAL